MDRQRDKNLKRNFDTCSIRADEENERKFLLSFASEEPYERWWGCEVLDNSEEAVDLTRLKEIGCLLFNHDRDKVIGKIEKAWVENNRSYAEVIFDEDEESEKIYQKVKNGTLKGVSVGYCVDSWESVAANKQSADDRFKGPCDIARKWTPLEISIVSVPADATVGVGREMETEEAKEKQKEQEFTLYEWQVKINKNKSKGAMKWI